MTDIPNAPKGTDAVESHNTSAQADRAVYTWSPPDSNDSGSVHPQADEIVRQLEYYFSDENLPHDAHLLGLLNEGHGTVSLNTILGFKKMRRFRPRLLVVKTLRLRSTQLLITGSDAHPRVTRREPLTSVITVRPKINDARAKNTVPADKPWLTRGMLAPTGFEEYATDGPIRPEEYAQDRVDYDPEEGFTQRIEMAITRFAAKKKMHANTRTVFGSFLMFGGMDAGQRSFVGGYDEKDETKLTKKEVQERTSEYAVAEQVRDGFEPLDSAAETWVVDFEAVAKGFFSTQFTAGTEWETNDELFTATNVLCKFYHYLLHHDVCPEYSKQIYAALEVCATAELELPKMREAGRRLPGSFSMACSMLSGGRYASGPPPWEEYVEDNNNRVLNHAEALAIFKSAIFAYGTEDQMQTLECLSVAQSFKVVSGDKVALEVVKVEEMNEQAAEMYAIAESRNTAVRPTGKVHCKHFHLPHAPPFDLPVDIIEANKMKSTARYEFIVDEDILRYCYRGLKFECEIKELDIGVMWIDNVEATYPSFFTWLPNERVRKWKEPGPPKPWMRRSIGEDEREMEPGSQGDADE